MDVRQYMPTEKGLKVGQNTGVRFETVFLSKNPPDDERIDRLIYWCQRLDGLGLTPKSAGNLSFRTGEGFVITGTGINLGALEREELVEVLKVETERSQILVYVNGRVVPSKESLLHSEVYDSRREINSVFHVHDQLVIELADELKIPCTEKEQPRGSQELVKEVNKLLGLKKDVKYFVLRNHGAIAMGETLQEAGRLAESMNKMAQDRIGKKGVR